MALVLTEIMDKERWASSVTIFLMNLISFLDKTTYLGNMDIEIIDANTEDFNK